MEKWLKKFSARMCRDTYFITRTELSQRELLTLGLKGHIGTDTAWIYDGAISGEDAQKRLLQMGWDGKKPLLGIAVIDPFCWPVRSSLVRWVMGVLTGKMKDRYDKWYFYSVSSKRRVAFEKYLSDIAVAVSRFQEDHDFFPVLIGMERMDEKACHIMQEKLGQSSGMFLAGEYPATVMVGILQQLSMLVTSRYHAAVLSMEKGLPIVAVSMDERLDGIMGELTFAEKYLHHVNDGNLKEVLYGSMLEAKQNEREIIEHIYYMHAKYVEKLSDMGIFLKTYINEKLQ